MEEIVLLNSFSAFGVEAGEHGIIISRSGHYCLAKFSKKNGHFVSLYLADEDYEYPDFNAADKVWIDKIDGSSLTMDDWD